MSLFYYIGTLRSEQCPVSWGRHWQIPQRAAGINRLRPSNIYCDDYTVLG